MSKSKICTIFMVLFLSQAAFGKPADSSAEKDLTPIQEIGAYIGIGLIAFVQEYTEKCIKVTREILKDEDFLSHKEPMIVEFKHNLTEIVDAYEAAKEMKQRYEIAEMFSSTTDFYYEIPEDKYTTESKYIKEILDKYQYKDIEIEMDKEFDPFVEEFMKMFEKHMSSFDKPIQDWYKKFEGITDFEKKLTELLEFAFDV